MSSNTINPRKIHLGQAPSPAEMKIIRYVARRKKKISEIYKALHDEGVYIPFTTLSTYLRSARSKGWLKETWGKDPRTDYSPSPKLVDKPPPKRSPYTAYELAHPLHEVNEAVIKRLLIDYQFTLEDLINGLSQIVESGEVQNMDPDVVQGLIKKLEQFVQHAEQPPKVIDIRTRKKRAAE